jgi:N-acetylmuramoyl-L-alanine amidase
LEPATFRAIRVGLSVGLVLIGTALPSAWSGARAEVPVVTDARLAGDEKETRLVLDLSRKVDLRAFTLADPYRVVVDLSQVNFQLPERIGERGRGLVKAFRYGLVMQGGSRIVIDVARPVRVEKAFVLDASSSQPARLVLELAATDRDSFMRNLAVENRAARQSSLARKPQESAGQPAARPADNDPRPVVVIDPGHGGIDTGTRAPDGLEEKVIVLDFAMLLRDKIEKTGKYRVVLTRTDDTFIPLNERVRLARAHQAQLFISIHCDALAKGEGEAQGATIYTMSDKASDSEAAKLADKENKADVIAGVDLSTEAEDIADILIDLAQRETKTFSVHFARTLAGQLKVSARLHKHPLKSAGFIVLRAPDVPSVLVELGYVSNEQDLKQLTSDAWRSKVGDSIVHAINVFFATRLAGGNSGSASGAAR